MTEDVVRLAVQEAASEPATDQTPTPTVTHYKQLAASLIATMNELTARIPHFESFHPMTAAFIRQNRNFPREFIHTVLAAVQASSELQQLRKFDVSEAEDTLQFLDAFEPLLTQAEALVRDLRFTMDARRAKVTADGLQVYYLAKGITRDPSSAALTAHVDKMRQDLGRSRPKRREKTPEPAPTQPAKAA